MRPLILSIPKMASLWRLKSALALQGQHSWPLHLMIARDSIWRSNSAASCSWLPSIESNHSADNDLIIVMLCSCSSSTAPSNWFACQVYLWWYSVGAQWPWIDEMSESSTFGFEVMCWLKRACLCALPYNGGSLCCDTGMVGHAAASSSPFLSILFVFCSFHLFVLIVLGILCCCLPLLWSGLFGLLRSDNLDICLLQRRNYQIMGSDQFEPVAFLIV